MGIFAKYLANYLSYPSLLDIFGKGGKFARLKAAKSLLTFQLFQNCENVKKKCGFSRISLVVHSLINSIRKRNFCLILSQGI